MVFEHHVCGEAHVCGGAYTCGETRGDTHTFVCVRKSRVDMLSVCVVQCKYVIFRGRGSNTCLIIKQDSHEAKQMQIFEFWRGTNFDVGKSSFHYSGFHGF